MADTVYLVTIAVDVGKLPAAIVSTCETCSAGLAAWVRLNGLVAHWSEHRSSFGLLTSPLGTEYGDAILGSFQRWYAAAAGRPCDDHFRVLRVSA